MARRGVVLDRRFTDEELRRMALKELPRLLHRFTEDLRDLAEDLTEVGIGTATIGELVDLARDEA